MRLMVYFTYKYGDKLSRKEVPVATLDELQKHPSKKFVFEKDGGRWEGFVVRYGGDFFAYVNECQHIHIPMDIIDNSFFTRNGEYLLCQTHGAMYDPETGECVGGPCVGQYLMKVTLQVKDGKIYLADKNARLIPSLSLKILKGS